MSELSFTLTGDANPLLRSFSRVKSEARALGKDIGGALGGSPGRAGGGGGIRGMLGAGLMAGGRLAGPLLAGYTASQVGARAIGSTKEAADVMKGAKESGLSPSDYAAMQVATERYGEAVTGNSEKMVAAMTEIKNSGEVLSDVDYQQMAKNSNELTVALHRLGNSFSPQANIITRALAAAAKGTADFYDNAVAGATALYRTGPTGDQSRRDDTDLNRANAILAGVSPSTPVDAAAVGTLLGKKGGAAGGGAAANAPFRIPRSGDALSRIGLFEGGGQGQGQAKVGDQLVKEARITNAQLRRLTDATKQL